MKELRQGRGGLEMFWIFSWSNKYHNAVVPIDFDSTFQ